MRRINNMGPTRLGMPTDSAITNREVSGQNHEREWKIRRRRRRWSFACLINIILVAVILSGIGKADGRTIEYCTTENTGIDSTKESNEFQSHGNCYDLCKGSYAFAIVQGYDCWCSNYAPQSTQSGCDQSCPGFPSDKCGDTQEGLYAYLECPNQPSGTSTTAVSSTVSMSSSPSTNTPSSSGTEPSTSIITEERPGPTTTLIITSSQKTSSTSSITSTTQSSTTTSSSSTSSSSSSSSSSSPSSTTSDSTSLTRTMLQASGPSITLVTTIGGTKTVMVAPTGSTGASQVSAMKETASKTPFFSQTGKVVGLFVGLALLIIAIVAGVLYFCYRRNLRKAAMYARGTDSPGSGTIPAGGAGILGRSRSRSLSTLGLVAEKGGAAVNTSPTAATPTPVVGTVVDQRLDPGQLFLRFENEVDSSRMSVRSLRDDADYSRRVLRLANPDE